MPDQLVQISMRQGRIDRVPRGRTPVIELHLNDRQYVAGVELQSSYFDDPDRKTVDWRWTAFVVTPLGVPDA